MGKIGPQIAGWVDNQKKTAEKMGVSCTSLNQMLTGKIRLPLLRFLQIAYILEKKQDHIDKVFNLFLAKVNLPPNSMRVIMNPKAQTANNGPRNNNDAIIDAVMASDIDDSAKVKVYNIIKQIEKK